MRISIIIPNYNGLENLKNNLPAVLVGGGDEVIVVDDASTDGSVEFLRQKFPQIKTIKNDKNMGFSSTVNRGVREAVGEIVVLLNTDVSPDQNFLEPLVNHFTNPQVFAVACLDKSYDEDNKIVLRGRGVASWQRGFPVHARGEVNKSDTFWVSCGSGAFKKDIWQKLGGLDPLYNPFYWEDIDLSYRAVKSGYRIFFEPQSIVSHYHQKGAIKGRFSPFYVKTISYRNQFFFVWKNITDFGLLVNHGLWWPYHFIKAILSLDLAFILGFGWALLKLPQVISARSKVRELFKLKDRELV